MFFKNYLRELRSVNTLRVNNHTKFCVITLKSSRLHLIIFLLFFLNFVFCVKSYSIIIRSYEKICLILTFLIVNAFKGV